MAAGCKTNQHDTLVRARLSQSSSCHSFLHREHKTVKRTIDHREKQESKLILVRNINLLQQDIYRIFDESLHCDLKIIHGYKIIQTHQCIIRIRSPWFYNFLRPYFLYRHNIAHCYIREFGIYLQLENFVRLLYTNLDISHYECYLIQIFLNASCLFSNYICETSQRESTYDKAYSYYMNCCSLGNVAAQGVNDKSPTSSDMADSGLETGSMISPQETISENSSTDLDEPNESVYHKKNDEILKICGETRSTVCNPHDQKDTSREANEIKDGISDFENRVLTDPFYDSNPESDDEGEAHSYVPTRSLKGPSSVALSTTNGKTNDDLFLRRDKITQNGKKPNITIEQQHIDINVNSSSPSNYYFIDASSLNDDLDITTTNVVGYPNDLNGRSTWSNPQLPGGCFLPSSRSNNLFHNDDSFKHTNRKTMNSQNQCEEVAEFEQELKLSKYLEPFTEPRKVKKLDSSHLLQEDLNCKSANKESLVVEIKEADSGESAQHSPCPDNTKVDNVQKVQNKLSNIEVEEELVVATELVETNEEEDVKEEGKELEEEQDIERRPSLIRRNTFELDANDEKLSSLRQEYERRQGSLVFQNSITQYSQHLIDGDPFNFDTPSQSNPDIINNLGIADSQVPPAPICDLVPDKYGLDTVEKEDKSNGLLSSHVDDESANYSITRSSSDKLLANYDDDEDLSFSSLPVNINDELSVNQVKSKLRRNEAAPIVSGGVSSTDFKKPTDSPIIKRKTESTPIVSGGSVIIPEPQAKPKAKVKMANLSSSMSAWVVDMSDCRTTASSSSTSSVSNERQLPSRKSKDSPPAMSASFSPSTSLDKDKDKDKSQHSSLGYFVNLEDIKSPRERTKAANGNHKRRPSDTVSEKNYCEFFVDLSETTTTTTNTKPNTVSTPVASKRVIEPTTSAAMTTSQPSDSKKNMFSMFIDLNEVEVSTVRTSVAKSHSSSKLADKRYDLTRRDSQEQQQLPSEEKKPKSGVFMFIESGSPVVRRRTLSSSRPAFKRHSWNTDKSNEQSDKTDKQSPESAMTAANEQANLAARRVHKRAHSLSVDRVGDFRKLFGHRTSSSSHSLNEAAAGKIDKLESKHVEQEQERPELEEGIDYDVRDTPPNSHVEIMNEELLVSLKNRNYQELDAINEQTMNEPTTKPAQQDECCSESSVWDKTPTESTETNQARKSETFDISSSASGPSSSSDNLDFKLADLIDATQNKLSVTSKKTGKNHQDTKLGLRNNDELVKNNSTKHVPPVSFVRLSDLDKRPLSTSANINLLANACQENFYRLSNSVTETSWIESKLVMSARSSNEPPHRTIGKKLPLSIATGLAKSDHFDDISTEGDAEAVISESDISSLQSSMGRSGQGSTEETETSTSFAMGKPYNRLGEDLLRMFLEEINPDVTIDVGGRRIRAHKCILSSRCQYFAAILSGSWIENAGNIISLQGYSYNAVHFALCHIYSGESCIPDTISIVELATLADMLCLEGLKEVIGFTLKVKYCHLFHKPCNGCAVGVLECMPLAAAYGLDEVYRKSLRWVTRHFVRIWPCKEFATLPRELMDRCYHQHIVHMSVDNVLQTLMDCDKLLTTLPNVRWAEPVFRLVSNLLDASMKYLTDNFTGVLGNETFQSLDRELTWDIGRLEDHLLAAAERLAPEQACKSYSKLDKMIIFMHSDDPQTAKLKLTSIFMELINKIRGQVEKCLVRDAARAARTNAWLKMDLELRRRIQELACLVILPNETTTKRPSRHSNFLKEPKERLEPKPTLSRTPPNRNLDLRKVKMAISEHNDKMLKQTPLLQTRKVMNKPKTDPLERKSQNDKLLPNDMSTVSRPKSWPNKIEVKSRYLEPRTRITPKEPMLQANQDKSFGQRRKIMISSSDSSRTSSPAMKRAAEKKALTKMSKVPMKKDGKALSSDSLTESKLSIKKDPASKSCGITRPESPSLKVREIGSGLSIDSLADPKKKSLLKKPNKMDTSMSTDSLMTDITNITTPKSATTNKSSPILGKAVANINLNSTRSYEKLKKSSPPSQQRNTPSATRRPARSLESSTAASRSRAAAVVNTYHGSLNLRKSLLDAAKAPDIPSKTLSSVAMTRTSLRQSTQSMRSSFAGSNKTDKIEKKDESAVNNQRSSSSPASKRSPKSNISSRLTKSTIVSSKQKTNKIEDKSSNKVKSQTTGNADGPKFLNQSSRSGTFLKDEPTILKKADIETAAIDV